MDAIEELKQVVYTQSPIPTMIITCNFRDLTAAHERHKACGQDTNALQTMDVKACFQGVSDEATQFTPASVVETSSPNS